MNFIKRPLITIAILIIAIFVNDYLLENVFFPGTKFQWISILFSSVEMVFLSYCISMVLGLKAIIWVLRSLFSKGKEVKEPTDPNKVEWPIIIASLLYGLFAGIIVYFPVRAVHSFASSLLSCTALSMAWGFVYLYFWKRKDLLWLLDWLYVDDPNESSFDSEEEEEKRKK